MLQLTISALDDRGPKSGERTPVLPWTRTPVYEGTKHICTRTRRSGKTL